MTNLFRLREAQKERKAKEQAYKQSLTGNLGQSLQDGKKSIANEIIDKVLNADEAAIYNLGLDEEKKKDDKVEKPPLTTQTYVLEVEVKPVVSVKLLTII